MDLFSTDPRFLMLVFNASHNHKVKVYKVATNETFIFATLCTFGAARPVHSATTW